MEKYGVEQDLPEGLAKLAARGCPECGRTPERQGQTLLCPVHGAEPFERLKEEGR